MPIEVSTDRPPAIAQAEAPFPRWKTISRSSDSGRPSRSAARAETYW